MVGNKDGNFKGYSGHPAWTCWDGYENIIIMDSSSIFELYNGFFKYNFFVNEFYLYFFHINQKDISHSKYYFFELHKRCIDCYTSIGYLSKIFEVTPNTGFIVNILSKSSLSQTTHTTKRNNMTLLIIVILLLDFHPV